MAAQVRTHLNMDHHQSVDFISLEMFSRCGDVWENRGKTGIKRTLWRGTLSEPQNCSKRALLHNTFKLRTFRRLFSSFGRQPVYVHTLTWTTTKVYQSVDLISFEIFSRCGDVWEKMENRNQEDFMWGTLSEPQNCSK